MEHRTKMEKLRAARGYRRKKELQIENGKLGLNQLLKPALYLLISIILEIVSFAIFDFKTASGSKQILPQYIFFDIGVWLFVCGLIICSKKNWLANIFFYIALYIVMGLYAVTTYNNLQAIDFKPVTYIIFPICALITNWLALSAINKDEQMVRDSERMWTRNK